ELTLMPGLIDCHCHLALDGLDFAKTTERWTNPEALDAQLKWELNEYLSKGVLTVRDGGDKRDIGLSTAGRVVAGELPGPLILPSGRAIYRQGRYGSFLGHGIARLSEAAAIIQQLASRGATQIKVLVSGIVSFSVYGKVGDPQFSVSELTEITRLAHSLGLPVMAHASSEEAVRISLRAGVDSLEHGYFISRDSLAALADSGITWVPTIVPVANQVVKPHLRAGYTGSEIDVISQTYREHMEKLPLADHLGVKLAIGTDAGASGVLHGQSLAEEMQLFLAGGLPMDKVLKAATSEAADTLGVSRRQGTISPGRLPRLIGVASNPLAGMDFVHNIAVILIPEN
ncbi:MAG TPA: amidohydrolase family protein, partial [Bacillota bacterium]|nr:amidohydrolase family protein [Bacillota bacterium]